MRQILATTQSSIISVETYKFDSNMIHQMFQGGIPGSVYNPYRQQFTSQEILNLDIA